MNDPEVVISDGSVDVPLPRAGLPINLTSTPGSEKRYGESRIRFELRDEDAMGAEPFDSLNRWRDDGTPVFLKIDDLAEVGNCLLRECNLDMRNRRLYITLYTPHGVQDVRGWFGA